MTMIDSSMSESSETTVSEDSYQADHPLRVALRNRSVLVGAIAIGLFVVLAIFGPSIAPFDPQERLRGADGELLRLLPPSLEHWMGTTNFGRDILSQVIVGTRRTLTVGFTAAFMAAFIGTNIGLIAGYRGGRVDNVLMRLTDAAYALPFLPFAIVLVGIAGRSDLILVVAIGSLFWRTTARVVRSQVLSVKERMFVKAALVGGASRRRILYTHIAPNIVPIVLLFAMLLTAEGVMAEAAMSFLGFSPPESLSWGTVMFDAFTSQRLREAWWWPTFPGLALMTFIYSVSLVGRGLGAVFNPHAESPRSAMWTRVRSRDFSTPGTEVSTTDVGQKHLVSVEDLEVTYLPVSQDEDAVKAVKGVSFWLDPGEMLGIVGESGSGKTTAVRALLRLLGPSADIRGSMRFEGRDLRVISDMEFQSLRWEQIAFVPQSAMNSLNPVQSIETQIVEAIRAHRSVTKAEAREMCANALRDVGINPGRSGDYPHQYSGGMRQRALIAMAMVLQPTLLVADEPTTGLDVIVQDQIMETLERVCKKDGTAVIIVSHDLALVSETCSKLIVMTDGIAVDSGPTTQVVSHPKHPYTRMLLNSAHGSTTSRSVASQRTEEHSD